MLCIYLYVENLCAGHTLNSSVFLYNAFLMVSAWCGMETPMLIYLERICVGYNA